MCGICGVLHFDRERKVDENLIRRMARIMNHRGPDEEGYHFDGNVGLGHQRLSIIDLSGGHQPISNEDSTIWIVYNGETYNYKSLIDSLKSKGHRFRTRSDTETLLHAYEEHGLEFLDHLRGMFAFAIWDSERRRLLLVRDRIGIKPVYYTIHDDSLYFASEIKSILQDESVPREINPEAVDYFLAFRYVPGPMTMFRNIFKIPPGGYALAEDGNVKIGNYWDLSFGASDDDDIERWKTLFEEKARESVDVRLMSEVPLGAFLSGGIDSSLVVAFMSMLSDDPVRTFSVGYENKPHINEFPYARLVAERYRADHRELEIMASDYSGFIPKMVWYLDEPVADYACLPLFFLSRLTREYVTVILSGEGADEMLAGYYIYKKMLFIEKLRRFPGAAPLLSGIGRLAPDGKLKKYLLQAGEPLTSRYRGISTSFTDDQRLALYPSSAMGKRELQDFTISLLDKVAGEHPLNQMLYFDTRIYLPDDLLVKADKMTMASSLELRVPFLDHELMELAAMMPVNAKLSGNTTKRIMREVAGPLLPEKVLNRRKRGFPVPATEWFAGELSGFIRDSLLGGDSSLGGMFERAQIERLIDRHQSGQEDCSDRIWPLLVLEYWKRIFIDSPSVPDLGDHSV